ncbi:MAG TPA: heavy metal-binding domain-containing protein [Bacteroidia bacterium]|nr:heavy metal-binding domain-containing protein [Bacteroidia bacterium]HNT79807.1 heavy metal-binding domain-containing protein [Bacteroidia bacterium]
MKKNKLILIELLSVLCFVFLISACGGEQASEEQATSGETTEQTEASTTDEATTSETAEGEAHGHAHYACPMDCEKGKQYEETGSCPVCKMELKQVEG